MKSAARENLRYLQFFALILWGYQSSLLQFALPMGFLWEAQFMINRRWDVQREDFYRLADLTNISLIAVMIFLFMNRTDYHFMNALVQWLPLLLFPLIITTSYSTREKIPSDVLFYSLRRQHQPVTSEWDLDPVLFGACLLAAGTNTHLGTFYFPCIALLVGLALFRSRPGRYQMQHWLLIFGLVIVFALTTQFLIHNGHLAFKRRTAAWIASWIEQRSNPLKTQTSIGTIGQLKLSNDILFRLQINPTRTVPKLIQEASYNLPLRNGQWTLMDSVFNTLVPSNDFHWKINHSTFESMIEASESTVEPSPEAMPKPTYPMDIYRVFNQTPAIIPVPIGASEIIDLAAQKIKQSPYGTVQAEGLVPALRYRTNYHPAQNINGPPEAADKFLPAHYRKLIEQTLASKSEGPSQPDATQPHKALNEFFQNYRYSLYQNVEGAEPALANFLLNSHAGHCEYFATASVLLLRYMGFPARYITGYSVQEYSPMLDMYVVRKRHAHAWATAFINHKWQIIDTTPQIWLASEAEQKSILQPIFDLISNSGFLFHAWWNTQKLSDNKTTLLTTAFVLSLILFWKIFNSQQIIQANTTLPSKKTAPTRQGSESPFYNIEKILILEGYYRYPGEGFEPWLDRIGLAHLAQLLPIHNQWRFDPNGISATQKQTLERAARDQIENIIPSLHSRKK